MNGCEEWNEECSTKRAKAEDIYSGEFYVLSEAVGMMIFLLYFSTRKNNDVRDTARPQESKWVISCVGENLRNTQSLKLF